MKKRAIVMGVLSVMLAGTFTQPVGAHAETAVWIGAPLDGTWPTRDGCSGATYPSSSCSLPSVHHTFYWGNPYRGDWGYDHQSVPDGADVKLYAAPNVSSHTITAKVQSVRLACSPASGETVDQTRRRGGDAVVVALYHGSTKLGTVTFVHINARVTQGANIARWGTRIGTVGTYRANGCWTGRHVHVELLNMHHYSCYNREWDPGQRMDATNFIGFIGGDYARSARQPCP